MTMHQIIETLNNFVPFSEDDHENSNETYFDNLLWVLENREDFELAFESIFNLFEKYPLTDFGMPGTFVHTLEKFVGHYEKYLFESLKRRPTPMTILMLNRIINGEQNIIIKQNLIDKLQSYLDHPLVEKETADSIKDFVAYQNKINNQSN